MDLKINEFFTHHLAWVFIRVGTEEAAREQDIPHQHQGSQR